MAGALTQPARHFDSERERLRRRRARHARLATDRDPVVFAWRAMMPSTKRRAYPRHAADPCHRIDIRRSSRHLVVRQDDQLVAETHVPLVLDESADAEPATSAEARA